MGQERKYTPPKESRADLVHTSVRALVGMIPTLGSVAAEVFNQVVLPPIEARRERWREMVGGKLQELEDAGRVDVQELAQDEVFITTLLHASQTAVRNHQKEKIEALKNAVINATQPNPPDESVQLMFINLIDEFTVWHLRILKVFQNPPAWFEENNRPLPNFAVNSTLWQLLLEAYPELAHQEALVKIILDDLTSTGLFGGGSLRGMLSANGAFQKRTTDLGNRFLSFITQSD